MYIQPLFWILTVTCFILVSGRAEGAKEVAQQSSSGKKSGWKHHGCYAIILI